MKPVNLNKVRKARARDAAKVTADRNAVIHGRTKAEKMLDATQNAKSPAHLSALKFDEDER